MKKRLTGLLTALSLSAAALPAIPAQAADIGIGDYLQMGTYYGEPILWRCVDIDENGPLMLADKIICIKPYDAQGEANTTTGSHSRASDRQSYGSNYWADSNMRSWLNSNASAGNVEWLCGNPPDSDHVWSGYNAYDQEAGFMTNFTTGELNAVKEVTQKSILSTYDSELDTTGASTYHYYDSDIAYVVQNYDDCYAENITDKFFLLDVKQVNAVYNNSDVLGEDYYIGEPTEQCIANSEYTSSSLAAGKKWHYWLRSPHATSNGVRYVHSSGTVGYSNAFSGHYGVRPAFYLNLSSVIFKSGSGTSAAPYTVEGSGVWEDTPTVPPTETPTATPTINPDLFEVEKYRANYVLTNQADSMENVYFSQTPGRVLVENGRNNGLDNTTDFWRGMNDAVSAVEDISKIADLTFEEKDMYEAIIWNIFESGTDSKLISKIDSQISDNGKAVYDFVSGQMKSMYNISVSDKNMYNSLSKEQKEEWQNLVSDSFKSEYPSLSKSMDLADKMDIFLDVATDIEDCVNRCSAYCELAFMQDSMKQVLKEMYQECPFGETAMKTALLNCITVMNSNEAALLAEMALSIAGAAGKRLGQVGMSAMWSGIMTGVKNAHPAVAVFLTAYKAGTFISNTLFNTDEIAEAYHKLDAVVKTEDIASNAYYNLKNQYNSDNTETNAANYNSAIDVMFNAKDYDCETSTAYIDSVENSFAGDISYLLGDRTTTERKASVKSIQESSYQFYESILRDWVYQLEEDNPEKYEEYKHVADESLERINKRYAISCPVDVYVYDEAGHEVGSVVNNKAAVNDDSDIVITAYNDEKFVYLDDSQYSLEYKATDNGTMDITVDEYNEKGKIVRTIGFDDLPLSKGTAYTSEDSREYVLTLDSTTIEPDYDTAENKADAVKKQLAIDSNIAPEKVPGEKETETSFNSTVSSWAKQEVEEAYAEDIIPEILVGEDLTKPVDRAEFAAIAVNLYENLSENIAKAGENPFNDIADNKCKSDILKAYNLGVTNGVTDITFDPLSLISREQVATMLTRAYKKSEFPNWTLASDGDYPLNYMGVTKYSDDDEISDYAKESVYFMTRWDILNGVDDTHFAPKNNVTLGESYGYATREQAVVIALRSAKHL